MLLLEYVPYYNLIITRELKCLYLPICEHIIQICVREKRISYHIHTYIDIFFIGFVEYILFGRPMAVVFTIVCLKLDMLHAWKFPSYLLHIKFNALQWYCRLSLTQYPFCHANGNEMRRCSIWLESTMANDAATQQCDVFASNWNST